MLEYRADGKKHIKCFANVISKYQTQTFLASKKSIFFKKKTKHTTLSSCEEVYWFLLFAENTSRFQHLDFCMWERSWQKLHGKTVKANQDTNSF